MSRKFITLLTDFGTEDPYVAMMKGVIYKVSKEVEVIDILHSIPPGDIRAGAFILREVFEYFPKGTIHLAVVDPGVGTSRDALLISTGNYYLIGPDNGLLWPSAARKAPFRVYHLNKPFYFSGDVSPTFHGRDLFAPVAAHLANGISPEELGTPTDRMMRLELSRPEVGTQIRGHVVWKDRFGNLITDISNNILEEYLKGRDALIKIGNLKIRGIAKTFQDVEEGQPLAYRGSLGYLEVGVNRGSAWELLGKAKKDPYGLSVLVLGFMPNNSNCC